MRVPIYFCGSIPVEDIANALHSSGIHIRIEGGHRIVADRIPPIFLKGKAAAVDPSIVVPLRAKGRRA